MKPAKKLIIREPNTPAWAHHARMNSFISGVMPREDETSAQQHARIQAHRYADWMKRAGRTQASIYTGALGQNSLAGIAVRALKWRGVDDLREWSPTVTEEACHDA
jgi:hypothetical protein